MGKSKESISRLQFLKSIGFGGSALMAVYLSSCVNESINPSAGANSLDLNDAANSKLLENGGFVIIGNIVVANVGGGQYAAVTRICSHEGQKKIQYQNGEFYCSAHGARFSKSGEGLNSAGKKGLTTYTVTQNGSVLTIS